MVKQEQVINTEQTALLPVRAVTRGVEQTNEQKPTVRNTSAISEDVQTDTEI